MVQQFLCLGVLLAMHASSHGWLFICITVLVCLQDLAGMRHTLVSSCMSPCSHADVLVAAPALMLP